MTKRFELTGHVYSKLTVIKLAGVRTGRTIWDCICECGATTVVRGDHLRSGNTTSCGCMLGGSDHGQTYHPLYDTWRNMIRRCTNPKDEHWLHYGGRGITICDRWMDIRNFIADMPDRPIGMELDRKDNDLGYSKDNCQWVTREVNMRNKRNSHLVEYKGKTMSLIEASELSGILHSTLSNRIKKNDADIFRPVTRGRASDPQTILDGMTK